MKFFYRAIAILGFVIIAGKISAAIAVDSVPRLNKANKLLQRLGPLIEFGAENLFNSALTKSESGDIQGAIADYTEAIRLNPNYAQAYNKRGILRGRNLKDYPTAKADFDRAIEIDPNYADAYYNRARVRNFLGDKNGAIADFQKAADIYQKEGKTQDYQDAINHLKTLQK
ncbi:MAG: tetratricopeptide repeat protein [Oscillatoriaceae cyanobacterium Prado104]|jgi:tetratricopeptide (TPR) repeat protein|nr:tetratricopeptide repeat protein [Oscillatoriaceae cyanobacterium Prado104]